jgi:excisionase family DNA binding protein
MRSIVSTSNKTILDSSYVLSKRNRVAALKLEEAPQFIREMADELANFIRLSGTGLAALIEAASVKISEVRTSEPAVVAESATEVNSKAALRVKEAAELLSISVSGMRMTIARGEVSVVRLGRLVRVPKTEVDRLLSENLVPARR